MSELDLWFARLSGLDALMLAALVLVVVAAVLAGAIAGRHRNQCRRCLHTRWDHRAEGCGRCGCESYQ